VSGSQLATVLVVASVCAFLSLWAWAHAWAERERYRRDYHYRPLDHEDPS
jgi:hypothetical protein